LIRLFVLALILFSPAIEFAQGVNTQLGNITPFGSYQGYKVDTVSLDSGNVILSIPLRSFRQRGGHSIIIAVRALYYRTFIDESESAPSEVANDERGIKPTLVTRVLMVSVMLAVAGFAIWRLSKP
jgi:hypothetical protein